MEMSPLALMASMKALVPYLTIVTRFITSSMLESSVIMAKLSGMILMMRFFWASVFSELVIDSYLISARRERFLVGVEGVDNQAHQLLCVGIESEGL